MSEIITNTARRLTSIEFWFYGLLSAFIGGGASAVTAAFTSSAVAPNEINLSDHMGNFFKVAGVSFVISGVMSAATFLKQSPLPPLQQPQPPETAQPK